MYDALLAEEAAGAAKGEGETDHQLSEEKRRMESEKLQEHLVSFLNISTTYMYFYRTFPPYLVM